MRAWFGILLIFPVQEIKRNVLLIRYFAYFSCTGNQENLARDCCCAMAGETD